MRRLRLALFGLSLAAAAIVLPTVLPGAIRPVSGPGAVTADGGVAAEVGAGIAPAVAAAGVGLRAAPLPPVPLTARSRVYREPPAPAPASALTGYAWPLARGRITVDFGAFIGGTWVVGGRPFHDGIDIASFCGDPVRAAHAGIVLAAGRRFDDVIGWVGDLRPYYRRLDEKQWWASLPITVVVDDGDGYRAMYAHLSRATVRVGQRIEAGQRIGYEGATGRASGCHLHFGLFSPLETSTFAIRADVAKRMATPPREIARVDPAAVLPPLPPGMTLGWGVADGPWATPGPLRLHRVE